ncbi:MAG: K(+)-transporting ATPase subunit F [Chloroflexi bacterium]|mgnify:CR=1 FL=1|nr:MAG: K(+)-transporting ATPase subunit F [Chloroflexota bacterium]
MNWFYALGGIVALALLLYLFAALLKPEWFA